jgi:tetratricopeptide (TPR) repeat protein
LENYADDMAVANLYHRTHVGSDPFCEARKRHEEVYHTLFLAVWTNYAWSLQEVNQAHELLQSQIILVNDVCVFVSAVTLSLMECFDLRKVLYLFDAYSHNAIEINQRALIGIVLIIHLYTERLSLYPEIAARLAFLNENETFKEELNRIYIQLLLCRETEKIDKKMREEIIPQMLKSAKNLRPIRLNTDEPDEEKDNDYNPDWQDDIEQSGLGDKIREITDLQLEGMDIYMSTFSTLKAYPFFKNISNWFYPFDKQHSEVVKEMEVQKNNAIMDVIFQAPFFCDSDKYSLCFAMATIPPSQREAMVNQMTAEQDVDEFSKNQDTLMMEERAKRPEALSSQYLRNLYRFFKLYPRRHEFHDVFNERIELHKYPVLADMLNKPEYLLKVADYYFRKDYPAEAVEIYANIVAHGGSAELFQKIGYCKQKEKKYTEAIDAYLKADMLQPDSLWTNRHLATCYRIVRSFEKALKYYRKIEAIQPDDSGILFHIGSCFAGLERYTEALNYFYKLNLLDGDNLKTWRAIGWCSFVTGKYEHAEKYYNKILEKEPLASDYLNAGHVAWSMKQTEQAIKLYSKAIEQCEDRKDFFEWFHKDRPMLIKQGIDEDDIGLMLDLL